MFVQVPGVTLNTLPLDEEITGAKVFSGVGTCGTVTETVFDVHCV